MRINSINTSSRGLDLNLIRLSEPYSEARQVAVGEIIFNEGELGHTMFLVLTGTVSVQKQVEPGGETVILSLLGPGEFIGEMALVEELPRSATVVAETDCEVLEFSKESFEQAIMEQPKLAAQVLASMSSKLRESDHYRIVELEEKNRLLDISNKELIRLNAFLDCVIDQSPTAIFLATRKGDIFRTNEAATSLFCLSSIDDSASVDSLFSDFHLSDFEHSGRASWHGEVTAVGKTDAFPVYLSIAELSGDNDSVLYLMICQDISELNAFNRTIQDFEKFRSVQEAAVELAHDMKNLLGVLFGNVELVLSRLTAEQEVKSDRAIKAIDKTSQDILSYVEDIMSHREDHSQLHKIDMKEVVESILRFCQSQGAFQNIKLIFDQGSDPIEKVEVRDGQIQSVLVNLMVNAAEALVGYDSKKEKTIRIELSSPSNSKLLELNIIDNGPGIAPDILDQMFKSQVTTKSDGHGIGLMSIKRIVEIHGGTVTVNSQIDQGSRFTIKLPFEQE